MIQKATRQQTKAHNRSLVLRTIFDSDRTSRAEIARITRLTRTTVSEIVADLLAEGLVSEVGVGESLGGKNPILLSLAADSRCLVGLDLAHNQFQGALVNLRGQIQTKITLPVGERKGEQALALVYRVLDDLLAARLHSPACGAPPIGIGVGTPGLVNTRDGVVMNAVNLGWVDFPLAQLLSERYRLPVTILNDSQAAAIGEFTYAQNVPADSSLVVINARHGIGAGIVLNGRLFQGDGGGAGEIGHITVVTENGLPCRCGNRGCLETVASAQAILTRWAGRRPERAGATLETVAQAYQAGEPEACAVVAESARYLGLAISHLVGVLNVHSILISGDMTCFGEPWLAQVSDSLRRTSFPPAVRDTHLAFGRLGADAVVSGTTAGMVNDFSLLFTGRL